MEKPTESDKCDEERERTEDHLPDGTMERSLNGITSAEECVKIFRSADSDSTDSRNTMKNASDDSYTSAKDISLINEKSNLHFCTSSLKELGNLPISEWNGPNAHKVLGAFRVKRYKIDPDYILCPTGAGLLVSDRLNLHSSSWIDIQAKIDRLTDVFKGDTQLITDVYDDGNAEVVKLFKMALERNIAALQKETFLEYKFSMVEHSWHKYLLNNIACNMEKRFCAKQRLQESYYEDYFHYLIRLLAKICELDICLKKTVACPDFVLAVPPAGKPQPVKPDFFLVNGLEEQLLAVVEVKTPEDQGGYTSDKGNRATSCQHPLSQAADKAAEASNGTNDEAVGKRSQENEEDQKNEEYDLQESLVEESLKHLLPEYLSNLDSKEKNRLRCVLPQLFGQMLASFSLPDRLIKTFDKTNTCRFGICVVGMKARFVSLVLKDAKEETVLPTAADLYRKRSVRPFLYVTRELNLFHKEGVSIFLRTLYALCTSL